MLQDIVLSALGIGFSVAAFFYCNWKASKPNDTPEPRMTPWRTLSMLALLFGLLIVAHLLNLAGFETGPGKSPLGRL